MTIILSPLAQVDDRTAPARGGVMQAECPLETSVSALRQSLSHWGPAVTTFVTNLCPLADQIGVDTSEIGRRDIHSL